MTVPDPISHDDYALDDVAAVWLCERDEGFTPERAQAFAAWRDGDLRHAEAVARVERTLELLGEMPAVRVPLEARVGQTGERIVSRSTGRSGWFPFPSWAMGVAAAVVVGIGAWWMVPRHAPDGDRYATGAAVQQRVALSDGSVIDLNGSSEVRVHFTASERRVTLGVGEAHFQVARDAARPFVVTADGVSVRAVGTAFNVRLGTGVVDVLVVEGKVEVAREALAPVASRGASPLLGAGERASVSRADTNAAPKVEKVDAATTRAIMAWQDWIATFTDAPLREIVGRFNRRNVTQLVLEDEELGGLKIGGVIALDEVGAFVRLLEQEGDVVAMPQGADKIVLRRAR